MHIKPIEINIHAMLPNLSSDTCMIYAMMSSTNGVKLVFDLFTTILFQIPGVQSNHSGQFIKETLIITDTYGDSVWNY